MRPEEAKRLYEDNDLAEAFQFLRTRYNKDFESANVLDKDQLQIIRLKYDLIRDVYAELRKVINEQAMKEK